MDEQIRARLDQKQYAEAFELLLSGYDGKVLHLAYSILGNRALAEDSTQDILVRIWRALPAYRGQSSISTWVFAIARNTCLTALRRQRKGGMVSLEEPGVLLKVDSQSVPTSRAPGGPDLPRLVAQLPEKYRQVIQLFYMEEKSYEEVAHLLGLPMGTVKTYLHRARKALAAAVMEANMEEGSR
jgi:RNA polymerase sigma-70 factor (ECF subfamily)